MLVAAPFLAAPVHARDGADLPADWRTVATPADRTRLKQWRSAWVTALTQVRQSGSGAAIATEGALFEPDRMLEDADLPVGDYRCRTFKLGTRGDAGSGYAAGAWNQCRVALVEGSVNLVQLDGGQRLWGRLLPGPPSRLVFLGTLWLGDERRPMRYGRDASRDSAGFVEHVGTGRWRLILPYPRFESTLDVVELRRVN